MAEPKVDSMAALRVVKMERQSVVSMAVRSVHHWAEPKVDWMAEH